MHLLPKRWQVAPPAPPSHIAHLSDLHPITVQVLYNRGVTDPARAAAFLSGDGGEVNPFQLAGMPTAVTRLRQALRDGESIAVYGDFDTDGVTATTLLVQTLRALGGNVRPYIPHRLNEGYGLCKAALTRLACDGVRVVVTVDCGVRAFDEISHANRLGLDVIVTDHHSPDKRLPEAVAVVDPKQSEGDQPSSELAGVGVAFKLAQALLRSHRQTPVTTQQVRLEEEDLLDLVALGTVADLVPLLGENRTLVRRGLKRINSMDRPGIEALCRQSGLKNGQIDAAAIAYSLGPRLNAAGRIACADTAYELLETKYPAEADRLAESLDQLNRERRALMLETQEQARQMAQAALERAPILFAAAPNFHAGIVGLVASRLVDEFYCPAVVVKIGEHVSRGSARSIPEFHITRALDQCAELLIRHGGHAAAAGFTIANANLERLTAELRALVIEQLADVERVPTLYADMEIELSEMTWELEQELAQLEPCGYANPQPLFLSRNVRLQRQHTVGANSKHLKLALYDGRITWDAIAFRQGEWAGKLPDWVDIVYHLEVNEWRGRQQLQLNVQDVRPTGLDEVAQRPSLYRNGRDSTEIEPT